MFIFKDNLEELGEQFELWARLTIPEYAEELADDILRIYTNVIRKHIPAGHRLAVGQRKLSTGRLWSGWGDRSMGVQTNNPDSTPVDNVAIIRRRKGRSVRFHVIVGTNVPYAGHVNDGRGPGIRHRYAFVQQGGKEANEIILPHADQKLQDMLTPGERGMAKRKFSVAAQRRNILGQFA